MNNREVYLSEFKLKLDELNAAVAEYESKAQQAQADTRILYKDSLFKLRQQLNAAHHKLDELTAASESKWDHFSMEAERVRDVFVESFNYFKSHI